MIKMNTICIIGLGYVGLPLACLCAEKGYNVLGLDLDKDIVEKTNHGISHIKDDVLEKKLGKLKGKIIASDNPDCLKEADIVIVCVPTPAIGSKPDLNPLENASKTVAKFLQKGQLVIIESTIYPGTVEEIVKPILESSGLKAGEDFFLGHCPERIDPGNKEFPIEKIPRVLACLSVEGTEKARKFYVSIIDAKINVLKSVKSAEAVKVVENTFRDVNIAFVNELAKSFDKMGIDLTEVIKGASTKPFGYMPFYPGPGVGGHCIAQDPYYLIDRAEKAGFEHKFLRLARKINEGMPEYVVSLVENALKAISKVENANIAVLGLSYKPDVDDIRQSPAIKIISMLEGKGMKLRIFDPFVKEKSNVKTLKEAVKNADLVILVTHHSEFIKSLTADFLKSNGVGMVLDLRNSLDKQSIIERGVLYNGIGR